MIAVPARSELGLQRDMELIAPAVAVDWQSHRGSGEVSLQRGSFIKKLVISLIRRSFPQLITGQKTHLLALVPEGMHWVGGAQWRTMAAICVLPGSPGVWRRAHRTAVGMCCVRNLV